MRLALRRTQGRQCDDQPLDFGQPERRVGKWRPLPVGILEGWEFEAGFFGKTAGAGFRGEIADELGEAPVEDLVLRLASNLVSFARLAAFGLTHAALGAVVWQATTALWAVGGPGSAGAVVVFLVGNAVTFALEGLVAAIQALRLEYYELFSRIFDTEGRPFRPWHVPLDPTEVPCSAG